MESGCDSPSWSKRVARQSWRLLVQKNFPFERSFLVLQIAAILAIGMIVIDLPLALFLKHNVSNEVFQEFREISHLGDATYWVALALSIYLVPNYLIPWFRSVFGLRSAYAVYYRFHLMTFYMLLVQAVGGIIVNILKYAFGRPRPSKFFATGSAEFDPFVIFKTSDSFPSGHSQAVWGAMMSLWFIYPPLRPLYVVLAVLGSLSRLIVHKHYLTDVIAGALISILLAVYLKNKIQERFGSFRYGAALEDGESTS